MNLEEAKAAVESKGYIFDGLTEFKTKDRIKWHNKTLKVNICLGKKIRDIDLEFFKQWVK